MNATHFHLALNHVPVIGLVFAWTALLVGAMRRSREIQKLALAAFVLIAIALVPVRLTGERAEERAERLPGVTENAIERHEEAAGVASAATALIGLAALAGLGIWRRRDLPRWYARGVLLLALFAAATMAWTANLGGQLRHTEIRSGPQADAAALAEEVPRTPEPGEDD